jgi:ABC-2 type transport system permease protein
MAASPVFVIASKDLKQRFRDRSAIVLGFIAPLAIALLMSVAFGRAEHFQLSLVVADQDHGPVASAFNEFLASPQLRNVVKLRAPVDEATATRLVKDGKVDTAIVIPHGFSTAATGTAPANLQVLTSVNTKISGEVAQALASSFASQVNADRLSVATALAAGAPSAQLARLVKAAQAARVPEQVVNRPIGSRPLKAVSYYGPAMAIFFLFFAVGFTSRSYFSEQSAGMIDRIAAAPVRPGTLLVGKSLSVLVYGLASLGTIVLATSLFFGANWGNPLAAAALCLAMTIAVVALTALVIASSKTDRQAEGFASIIVFGLALLGGNFLTISAAPPLMRRLALLTPNGWALRGFVDLSTGAHGAAIVLEPVLAMLAFAAIIALIAGLFFRRTVMR